MPVRPNRVWRMVKPAPISTIAARNTGCASSMWNHTRCWRAEKPACSSRSMKPGSSQIGIAEGVPKLSRIWSRLRVEGSTSAASVRASRSGFSPPSDQVLAFSIRQAPPARVARVPSIRLAGRPARSNRRNVASCSSVPSRSARAARITVCPSGPPSRSQSPSRLNDSTLRPPPE